LRERERLLRTLLPWPHPNFGLDPQWARLYPYWQTLALGAEGKLTLRVVNSAPAAVSVQAALDLPVGWKPGGRVAGVVARASEGALPLRVRVPRDAQPGRHVLAARVSLDGRDLGAWAEALVDLRSG
jgi:hypothetical protein